MILNVRHVCLHVKPVLDQIFLHVILVPMDIIFHQLLVMHAIVDVRNAMEDLILSAKHVPRSLF
jgi:hypothetical protein